MSLHVVSVPGPGNHPATGAGSILVRRPPLDSSEYWATAVERWLLVLSSCPLQPPSVADGSLS